MKNKTLLSSLLLFITTSIYAQDLYLNHSKNFKMLKNSNDTYEGSYKTSFDKYPKGPNKNYFMISDICEKVDKRNYAKFESYKGIWSDKVFSNSLLNSVFKETQQYYIAGNKKKYLVAAGNMNLARSVSKEDNIVMSFYFQDKKFCLEKTRQILFGNSASSRLIAFATNIIDGQYQTVVINKEDTLNKIDLAIKTYKKLYKED
jgi:hypothetical protein